MDMKSYGQDAKEKLRVAISERANQIALEAKGMDIGLEPGTIADSYIYVQRMESFKALRASMLKEWRFVFQDIDAYAPNDYIKTLLILSLRELPAEEYLTFMERALDLAVEKRLSLQLTEWALFPAAGPNVATAINSYHEPRVRAVLLKAKRLFGGDPQLMVTLDDVLSGRAKVERDKFIRLSTGKPSIADPKLPGSPTATPVPPTASPTATPPAWQPSSAPAAQTTVPIVERKSQLWPWVIGILALVAIMVLVFKRRA